MTRIKSITDISSLYESMYKNTGGSELVEEKKSAKKFPKGTFPKAGETVKEPKTMKDSGPEKVKGLKKVKKSKKSSRKNVRENINSFMKSKFDKLFENVMDDELDLGPSAGPEGDMESDTDVDTDFGGEEDMGGNEVTVTLDKETAQTLIDVLQAAVGGEEDLGSDEESDLEDLEIDTEGGEENKDEDEEEVEDEDEEVEDEDEEEEDSYSEEVEAEKLSDEHGKKLTKGMDAAGNIKASKGKASTDVTKASDLTALGDKGHVLTKKDNKVSSSIKAGHNLFS